MNSPIGGTVPSNNTGHLYPKQVMPQAPVFKNSRNLVTSNHHTSLKAANQSDRIKAQIKSGYSHPYNYDGTSGSPSASRIERGFVGHSQGVSPLGLIGETPKKIENRWIPYEESPEPTRKVAAGKSNIPSDLSKIIEKEISKAQQISSRAIEPSRRVNDYMSSFMNKNLQSHRNSLQEQPSHPRVPMSMQNSQVQKQPVQPKQALRQQQPSMDLGRARQLAQGPQSSVRMGRAGEQRLGSTQLRPHQAESPERQMTHDLLKPDRHPELFPNHQQDLPQGGGISAEKPVHDAYNPDYQPKSIVEIMKQSNINPSLQASPRSKFVDYRKQVKKTINRLPPLAQDRREHTERVGSVRKRNESYQNTERSARDLIDLQTPDYPAAGLPLNSRYNFPKHYLLKGEDPNRTSVSNAWDNPATNRTHLEAVPIPQVEVQPPHSSVEGTSFMTHNQPSFQLGNSFDNALNIIEPHEPSFSPGNSNRTFRQNSPEASAFVFPSAPNPTQTVKRDQNNAGLQPQLPVVIPIPGSRVIGRNHRRFETQPDIPHAINPVFSSIETSGDEPKSLERSALKYPGLASLAKGQPDRLSPPLATPFEQPYQSNRDQPYGANPSSSRAPAMTSVKKPNYQPTFHQEPFILVENMEEEQVVKPNNVQAVATSSQRQTNRSMMQKQAPLEPTSKFESHRPSLPETKPILKNNLNDHRFRGGYLQKRYNPGKRQVSIFDKGSDYESTIKSQKLMKGGTMVQKKTKPLAVSPYEDPTQKPFYNSLPTALGDSGGGGVTGGSGSTGGERAVVGGLVNGRAQKKLNYFSKIAEYELNRAKSKCQNSSMAAMSNSYVVDHLRNQYDSLQGSMHLDLQARLQSSQVRDSAGQDGLQKQDLVKMQNQKSMEESLERIEVLE